MAQSIRISDELYALAQRAGGALDRSLAQQMEYWARLGAAIDAAGITSKQAMELLESGRSVDTLVAVATGRTDNVKAGSRTLRALHKKLDDDVVKGRRSAESLLAFRKEDVKASKVTYALDSTRQVESEGW
jgi:hypothetical protein